jgi:hypothetical protein
MITRSLAVAEGVCAEEQADASALQSEGVLLGRYILRDRTLAPEAIELYVGGCSKLFRNPAAEDGLAVSEFVRRHPWALPLLDAAAALFHPQTLLRRKLLLMLSILETMPRHTPTFESRPRGRSHLLGLLLFWGFMSGLKVAAGIMLYRFADRSRRRGPKRP